MIIDHLTKEETSDIIKRAIEIGRYIPLEVNRANTMHWWRLINHSLFDGQLQPPKDFVFKWFYKGTFGWCVPYGKGKKDGKRFVRLGMSTDLTRLDQFLIILIHEMVHQWEWEINNDWNDNVKHGKAFYSWRDKIKAQYNVPLTAKYDF